VINAPSAPAWNQFLVAGPERRVAVVRTGLHRDGLAALDAAERGPTFGSRPGEVVAIVAVDAEGAEDDREAGVAELVTLGIGIDDVVVGVSASGSTPYTVAALEAAGEAGALRLAVHLCARQRARRSRGARDRGRRRAGGGRGFHAPQGGHGAEARV